MVTGMAQLLGSVLAGLLWNVVSPGDVLGGSGLSMLTLFGLLGIPRQHIQKRFKWVKD